MLVSMKKTRTRHDIIKTRTILSLQINQCPRNRQGSSYRQHHISTRSINGDKVTKKQHVATFADAHLHNVVLSNPDMFGNGSLDTI